MVECTRDKKWAAGVTLWSDEVKNGKKQLYGKNLLGQILERERDSIINKGEPDQFFYPDTLSPLEVDKLEEDENADK